MTLMLPYMIFVGGLSGKTGLHLVVAESVGEENFPRAVDIQITKYNPAESPSFFNELLRNPYKMAKRWVINLHLTHKFVIPGLFPPLLLIAIGFGIFRMKFRFTQWKELYIAFSWIPYLFVLFLIIVGARFLLPLVPVSLILGARGIEIVEDRLYKRVMKIKNLPIKQTVHHLIFAAVLLSLLPYTFRPLYRPDDSAIYRDAGIWIKENISPPIKIIDRKPWVAFYSNAELIPLPIGEYDEVIQYVYKKDADYLIIDNRIIPEVRPELTFLLSKYFVPHELKLVREFKNKNGQIVLLYQILRDK